MMNTSVLVTLLAAIRGLQLSPSDARRVGELTRMLDTLADQAFFLAGGGALLGLGIGVIVSGAGVYLYKRRQIRTKLNS